jgi:SAM-dependent MidA family methyltransferase
MLPLAERLRERIQREGPISFRDWMAAALYDAEQGYYCAQRHRWGRGGDYRTSPERSLLFAATFARYFAKLYVELGSPSEWVVIEVGPGPGEFAEVVLETLRVRSPEVFAATRYVVDELSPHSRGLARARLARFGPQVQFAKLESLELALAGIIFSNELLDAFAVHRVTMREGKLQEFFVEVTNAGALDWKLSDPSNERLKKYLAANGVELAEGQIVEVNLEIDDWLRSASKKLERGHIITVDYGAQAHELYSAATRPEGTLRSFQKHRFSADILENPGEQDITSSVNWSQVMKAGESLGFETIEFERQDRFLMKEGLLEELDFRVKETKDEAEKARLRTNAREMILPDGMAASFQVLVQRKQG